MAMIPAVNTPSTTMTKRRLFKQMHHAGCFMLPNPWDAGSALLLGSLGFKALASSSAGFAWSCGRADGALGREQVLAHLKELVSATALPVNADFENGFGKEPSDVAESVRLALETGIAGLSIEDKSSDPSHPIFDVEIAVERLRAARAAIDRAGGEAVLVGRAENFITGRPDLKDTIVRLQAYAEAGADCLYAPGIRTRQEIAAVVAAVAPKPVNVLVGWPSDLTLADLGALGVRRVSVGGALARSAWGGLLRAARSLAQGRFDEFGAAASGQELNALFEA
jgi:2-methylisocitrate lyase-like PEP mutase family enzyme